MCGSAAQEPATDTEGNPGNAATGEEKDRSTEASVAFKRGLEAYLKKDYATAHAAWRPLALQGDRVAAFNLGVMFARGQGTKTDHVEAVRWYRAAADTGYTLAQFNLGAAFMAGKGVPENHNQAARWWALAAQGGHPQALFNLGTLYLHGDGVPHDPGRGLTLIQQAADLGDARAYEQLQALQDPTRPPPVAAAATAYRNNAPPLSEPDPKAKPKPEPKPGPKPTPVAAPPKKLPPVQIKTRKTKEAGWATAANSQPPATAKQVRAQVEPESRPDTSAGAPPKSAGDEKRNSAFMAVQDPQQWTIQVSAFQTQAQAEAFIQQSKIKNQAILIEAKVKNRLWYKVMYGIYPDATQAKRAIDAMEAKLRKRSPWARRIGVVQKELATGTVRPTAKPQAPVRTTKPQSPGDTVATPTKRSWRTLEQAPSSKNKAPPAKEAQDPAGDNRPVEPSSGALPDASAVRRQRDLEEVNSPQDQFQAGQAAFNDQNYARALELWGPLARNGLDEAQYGLGFMYESGWGVKKDYLQAYQWYRRAAEQGHAQSQFNLGLLYQAGLGVPQNDALANYWIQSAADRDDPRAKEFLRSKRKERGGP